MITVKPSGGLANRMRAIDSALLIGKSTGHEVSVIWEMSFELNCSFRKLFCLPDTLDIREYSINRYIKRTGDFLVRKLRKAGIILPFGFERHLFDIDILAMKRGNVDFINTLGSDRSIFINTVHQFYNSNDSFVAFKPIPELQKIIEQYVRCFSANTVGVHIRRQDNIESIKHSPIEDFISSMEHEIVNNSKTSFFLATDSEQVEKTLRDVFKERILTHKKVLDRNSEVGIQDALIDLFCLSKTKKIFGSYYSSFSDIAAQINNIELVQIYRSL